MIDYLLAEIYSIPPISACYLSCIIIITCLLEFNVLRYSDIYFNGSLFCSGEIWRLPLSFCFFGDVFNLNLLYNLYTVYRYFSDLEGNTFHNARKTFLTMILFVVSLFLLVNSFMFVPWASNVFLAAVIYIWSRFNKASGLIVAVFYIDAGWYPYLNLLLRVLGGMPIKETIIGCLIGHIYYFSWYVFPKLI